MSGELIWLLIGIILIIAELFIPGLLIIFFGAGALVTALTTWIGLTTTIHLQLFVFCLSSIIFIVIGRIIIKKLQSQKPAADKKEAPFNIEIGKLVPVVEYIEPGAVGGKVRYQGILWSAVSDEPVAPGESVKIVGCDNLTLKVEKQKNN